MNVNGLKTIGMGILVGLSGMIVSGIGGGLVGNGLCDLFGIK